MYAVKPSEAPLDLVDADKLSVRLSAELHDFRRFLQISRDVFLFSARRFGREISRRLQSKMSDV